MAAIQGKDAGKAALMGGLGGAISGGMGAYADANVFNAPNLLAEGTQKAATEAGTQAVTQAGTEAVTQGGTQALGSAATPQSFAPVNQAGYNLSIPDPNIPGGFISSETGQALASAPSGSGLTAGEMMAGSVRAGPIPPVSAADAATAAKTIGNSGIVTSSSPGSDTIYSGLGSYGKAGVQALPVLGLLEDEQQSAPQDNYQSPLRRISPDFKAYEPPRPDPYYRARYAAEGGIMQSYQSGGPVERMSMANTAMNPQGGLYPQGMIDKTQYAVPTQRPTSMEVVDAGAQRTFAVGGAARLPKGDPGLYRDADPTTRGQDAFTAALTRLNSMQKRANIKGLPALKAAAQPLGNIQEAAKGGVMSSLGGYSDGGRMLKGPGDGMSDSIPASIANKQPARLADGEFVVPADVVSHLGNGSTDAGARKLYAMMDKIRKARTGKKKQAPAVKADRYMPA
jgi:hypothetical protein